MKAALPVDDHLDTIRERLARHRALVVTAPPGSGKSTRIPPALLAAGPLVLTQPRRMAARALARRIAAEGGVTVGEEVGWQVRFDRRYGPRTRLLVVTDGILNARAVDDPLLSDFRTVVLDEFHERSIASDLALAFTAAALAARDDLRLVVMSATLRADEVATYLGGCPVLEVEGRAHPVEIEYAPDRSPAETVRGELAGGDGRVLVFLPGVREIEHVARELQGVGPAVLPLHGRLDAAAQDRAVRSSGERDVVLATNVAETSLTIEEVRVVVDSGLHRVMRADPETGIDRLATEHVPRDSADQRAGRAGRTAPGRAIRLWDPRRELRPHREPEIHRVDLARPLLDVLSWGGAADDFAWFEPPDPARIAHAAELLARLGALDRGRLTSRGAELARMPLGPRLAALLRADPSTRAARLCAALGEGLRVEAVDVLALADRTERAGKRVRDAVRTLTRFVSPGASTTERTRRAIFAAFPDRVARVRADDRTRVLFANGTGGRLPRGADLGADEWLVVVASSAGARGPRSEASIRLASPIDKAWIPVEREEVEHSFDADRGAVRAVRRTLHGRLVLGERPVDPDPDRACALLTEALLAATPEAPEAAFRRRLAFAGIEVDLEAAARAAVSGRTSLPDFRLADWLARGDRDRLDRLAPADLEVPSGRRVGLDYRDDGEVVLAVKLQELFGLTRTPRLGPRDVPVTFELLAPNGRPVQRTRDLEGFWERTYPEVRRDLRGRYAKHPWPEDPRTATATARAKPRRRPT